MQTLVVVLSLINFQTFPLLDIGPELDQRSNVVVCVSGQYDPTAKLKEVAKFKFLLVLPNTLCDVRANALPPFDQSAPITTSLTCLELWQLWQHSGNAIAFDCNAIAFDAVCRRMRLYTGLQ